MEKNLVKFNFELKTNKKHGRSPVTIRMDRRSILQGLQLYFYFDPILRTEYMLKCKLNIQSF